MNSKIYYIKTFDPQEYKTYSGEGQPLRYRRSNIIGPFETFREAEEYIEACNLDGVEIEENEII